MKIHIYALAFCLAGFAACGDDDGNGSATDSAMDAVVTEDASTDDASADAGGSYYTGDPDQCVGLDYDTNTARDKAGEVATACFGASAGDDEAFRNCVRDEVKTTDEDITDACGYCYGVSSNCGSEFCLGVCIGDTGSDACAQCRCENGCFQAFDDCSGLDTVASNCE